MKSAVSFKVLLGTIFSIVFLLNVLTSGAQNRQTILNQATRTTQPVETDDKGPVNTLSRTSVESSMLTLGSVWTVRECCGWNGTWIRRPNTNTFDARWRNTNGATASDVLQLSSWDRSTNSVVITRKSMNGYYKATYNPTTKTLTNGSTTWYNPGLTWSATIE